MANYIFILACNSHQYNVIWNDLRQKFLFNNNAIYLGPHNYDQAILGQLAITVFHEGNMPSYLEYITHRMQGRVTAIQLKDRRVHD